MRSSLNSKWWPPFFCAIFCEKNRYFWTKAIKQTDWRKKNETIVNMIANVFNHQLFWEKQRKNINFLFCTLFKKRLSFCCFDSYHCQTSLSKEQWFCVKYHHWKKQQRPKKVSNFHLATFVWFNKNFEYISPKLNLLGRKNWDSSLVWKKFYPH